MSCASVPTPARRARRSVTAAVCAAAALVALPAAPVLAADGDLDHGFNGTGYAVAQPGPDAGFAAEAVLAQPDGKVVVAGSADAIGGPRQFGFARFLPGGGLDPDFGDGGLVRLPTPGQGGPATVHDLALDGQGRIVAVGGMYGPSGDSILTAVRLEADGDHDKTFNAGSVNDPGWYYLHGTDVDVVGRGVAIQPQDGHIVIAGRGIGGVVLVRLTEDGAPDPSLSPDGFRGPHQIDGRDSGGVDVALQPDRKIVVAATALQDDGGLRQSVGVLRFEEDGDLDQSFSGDGMTSARSRAGAVQVQPSAVAIEGDGILVAGTETVSSPPSNRMVVARFEQADGDLDGDFGTGGWAHVPGDASRAHALLVHGGELYVGGETDVVISSSTRRAMSLARLSPAGDVDASFGDGGVSTWLAGTGPSSIRDLAAYDAGRVIAGGEARNGSLGNYAAARFLTAAPPADDDDDDEEPQPQQPGGDQGQPPVQGGGSTPPAERPGPQVLTPAEIIAAAKRAAAEQLDAVFLALRNDLLKTLAAKRAARVAAQAEVPGKQVLRFLTATAGTRAVAAAKKKKRKRGKTKVLAKGSHTFTAPGTAEVRVKLTRAGRKAIRRGKRVRIVVESAFTPVGASKQVERRTVSAKVPGKKKKKRRS